jgi:AcrR family transcriptional regulator
LPRHADPYAKEALVAAARAEFAKKGLRGARIEDITSACGLSKGAFYLHYPSKEALFGELVTAFATVTRDATERRKQLLQQFLEQHGAVTPKDVFEKSERYRTLLQLEIAQDLALLEHLWAYRDVVGVLVRGSQGTSFEGFIWIMTDGEVDRVQEDFTRFQGGACRSDIPTEMVASLIVGTYLLLAMRMSRMSEKPDLAEWARGLHTLIREGSAPIASPPDKNPRSLN